MKSSVPRNALSFPLQRRYISCHKLNISKYFFIIVVLTSLHFSCRNDKKLIKTWGTSQHLHAIYLLTGIFQNPLVPMDKTDVNWSLLLGELPPSDEAAQEVLKHVAASERAQKSSTFTSASSATSNAMEQEKDNTALPGLRLQADKIDKFVANAFATVRHTTLSLAHCLHFFLLL